MENIALIDVLIIAGLLFFVASRFFKYKLPKGKAKKSGGKLFEFPTDAQAQKQSAPKPRGAPARKPKPMVATKKTGLAAFKEVDPAFDRAKFMAGAKQAYGLYHEAYTNGDEDMLHNLLSPRLFDQVFTERDGLIQAGQQPLYEVKEITDQTLVDARLSGQTMIADVKYTAKVVMAVLDDQGKVVKGKKTVPVDVTEIWTWARNASSEDPNWELEQISKPS